MDRVSQSDPRRTDRQSKTVAQQLYGMLLATLSSLWRDSRKDCHSISLLTSLSNQQPVRSSSPHSSRRNKTKKKKNITAKFAKGFDDGCSNHTISAGPTTRCGLANDFVDGGSRTQNELQLSQHEQRAGPRRSVTFISLWRWIYQNLLLPRSALPWSSGYLSSLQLASQLSSGTGL